MLKDRIVNERIYHRLSSLSISQGKGTYHVRRYDNYLASSIAIVVQDTGKWYDAVMQMGLIIVMPILKSYNREAGRKTLINKWVFYLFYPFHLLLFWLILKS